MKRIMAALLMACMLLSAKAFAQGEMPGVMQVVNCQEWVSLRARPDAKSECLVEVPLGALVENCRKETKAFYYGEFRGMGGFIMAQYLQEIEEAPTELGEMTIADSGQWVPMYADTTKDAVILQWMAPGETLIEAREPVEGFVYGSCRGVRGYVAAQLATAVQPAGDEGTK